MISRRAFLSAASVFGAFFPTSSQVAFADGWADQTKGVTAITEVFGNGQRLTAVAIEYDAEINSASLSPSSFTVESRTATKVYANSEAMPATQAVNGKFVIVELSPEDADAPLYVQVKRDVTRREAKVSVTQSGPVVTVSGETLAPAGAAVTNSAVKNLVVDDFQQFEYKDSKSGEVLKYNLFVPKAYDKAKSYPLVLFMHDAGATSDRTDNTLVQGIGAIAFANPEDQAKREAFVLAPQFTRAVVDDQSQATSELDMVVDLINQLAGEYSIDKNRLYATGQSGGGMLSIAMNIKYPDFFAASFLVACQWDPSLIKPLATDKLWIVVSEGDEKAYPGQNAITTVLEQEGAKVSRAVWEGTSTAQQFAEAVNSMEAEGNPIKYVALKKGTVVPAGQEDSPGGNHVNTWRIAYTIEGIRDWLFRQAK
jgi:predicted peptidase